MGSRTFNSKTHTKVLKSWETGQVTLNWKHFIRQDREET